MRLSYVSISFSVLSLATSSAEALQAEFRTLPETFVRASNIAGSSRFGFSVAIEGDVAVIGAPFEDEGRAVVYRREGVEWVVDSTLDGFDNDSEFGFSVDTDGEFVVVGAPEDGSRGRCYVYEKQGGSWQTVETLTPTMVPTGGKFGAAVSIDRGRLAVGAPDGQVVKIYQRMLIGGGALWAEEISVDASGIDPREFGSSVALDGDRLLIGDPDGRPAIPPQGGGSSMGIQRSGTATLYSRLSGAWRIEQELIRTTDVVRHQDYGRYGFSVGLSGGRAVVSKLPDSGGGNGMGNDEASALTYSLQSGGWILDGELEVDRINGGSDVGAVDIRGDTVLLGHPDDVMSSGSTGSWSCFRYEAGAWQVVLEDIFEGPTGVEGGGFSVALDDFRVLIGAPRSRPPMGGRGAAEFYKYGTESGQVYGTMAAIPNVSNQIGLVRSYGSNAISTNAVIVEVDSLPTNAFGLLILGPAPATTNIPFGNGTLLIDPNGLSRGTAPIVTDASGVARFELDLTANAQFCIGVGQPTYFQFWHRDGPSFNVTAGLLVDWFQ